MKQKEVVLTGITSFYLDFEHWSLNFELYDKRALNFAIWTLNIEVWILNFMMSGLWTLRFGLWTLRFEFWTLWWALFFVNVEQIIKPGKHALFISMKRFFIRGNVLSVVKQRCFHQRIIFLLPDRNVFISERNVLSIGIPFLFLLFFLNYLRGEKYFSLWR